MIKQLITKLRRLLYDMKLFKGSKSVQDAIKVSVSEEMYTLIEQWKQVYGGYYPDFHDVTYTTVAGKRQRKRASLKMPKVVSQKMATLIFNEQCEVHISNPQLEETIQVILKDNKFDTEFRRYLEYAFAMGGMAMKVYVEDGKVKLSYNTADTFIPVAWDNTRVSEGIFISTFTKGDKYYSLLEWNVTENGKFVIKNELYESKNQYELGIKVNLKAIYPDLEERIEFNSVQKPLFVYFKPNTANNFDTQSPLGISLFANAMDTLKSLDIAFDSFQREFVLGKKRIIVPATAINTVVDPQSGNMHRYFDAEDEVYQAMDIGDMDNSKIADISVEIRVEEHVSAINALLNMLAMQIGFSSGAFTFDGTGVKTATEVVSEQSETFRTKKDHENNAETAICELVDAIVEIADAFNIFPRVDDYEVTVNFDDSIIEDKKAEIDKQILLVTSGLTTKVNALQKIHGITKEEAVRLLQEIIEEQRLTAPIMPDMADMYGGSDGEDMPQDEEPVEDITLDDNKED